MTIRLNFTASQNALPAIITIRETRGELVLYETVYCKRNSLCFCAESKNLTISVRPLNSKFKEKSYFFKLGDCPCYDIDLDFVFTETVSLQRFRLLDANYLFPIENAELTFSGGA